MHDHGESERRAEDHGGSEGRPQDLSDSDRAAQESAPHVRRLRLRAIGNRLRESLLFLPLVLLVAAIGLEAMVARIDARAQVGMLEQLTLPPDAAVTLLATIAGATITTAGVVFSLLVVTLQLASGQFSPRVLRTFWRDRFGQVLIGLLLATFAFCVLALTQIDTSAAIAPTLTVQVSMVLAFASIVVIVAYLNRITRHQYVGRIMERIAAETLDLVDELPYGPHIGIRVGDPVPHPDLGSLPPPLIVRSPVDGWVQQISRRAIVAATPPRSVVRIETRVGAYLVRDEPFATIWPVPPQPDRVARLVAEAAIVGASRTMQQDIDFGLRQLSDIALRALSAAVNDQTTAIEAVLRVSSIMRPLLRADLPAQAVRDPQGRILLTPWDLDHGELVHHAVGQLRIYAAGHPQVAVALVRALVMLRGVAAEAGRPEAVAALDEELALTLEGCAHANLLPADLALVRSAAAGPNPRSDARTAAGGAAGTR